MSEVSVILAAEAETPTENIQDTDSAEESATNPTPDLQPKIFDGPGLPDLDRAMCEKVTAEGIRDLYLVIDLAQSALDKGLCVSDQEFGQRLLSNTLMERATTLIRVVDTRSFTGPRAQQVRGQVVSDLRRILTQDHPPAEAYIMLGRLMALPGGDPHEAKRLLTSYLALDPLNDAQRAEALILRAKVTTNEAKSLADYDEAIRLMPDNANYLLARALFHRAHHRLDRALADIDIVMKQTPGVANGLILQGEILREQGKLEQAIASFDQATEITPHAPGPYQNRGEIYRLQNKFEQAIEQFNKVLEMQPGVLLTLVHRAEANMHAGNLQRALADIDAVLNKQPQLVSAHRIRAEIFASLKRLPEAIREMAQIAKALPEQLELKMQLALYYLVNEQLHEAIEAYSSILELDPENFLALRSRADTYLSLGEHVLAAADFKRALKIKPDDTPMLNNYAWLLATSPNSEVRNGKLAVELATKACMLTQYEQAHILSTLAASYAESGDFTAAVKWSQQAVDLASENQAAANQDRGKGTISEGSSSATETEDPSPERNQEIGGQLAAELASYHQRKPWREKQSPGSNSEKASPKSPTKQKTTPPTETPNITQPPGQSVDAN